MIKFGFLGGGRMASAIREALSKENSDSEIGVFDPFLPEDSVWSKNFNFKSSQDLLNQCEWLFLAVKPQIFKQESDSLKNLSFSGKGVISVMAGIDTLEIESIFPKTPIVRTMPNTPMMLGEGMLALCGGSQANQETLTYVESLFSTIAETMIVREDQMDSVTAISGSGPAYFFYLTEALEKQAEQFGLSQEQVKKLWVSTMKGAAVMLKEQTQSSTELKVQVTSPGGTTQAALESFDKLGLDEKFVTSIMAAKKRCIELGK